MLSWERIDMTRRYLLSWEGINMACRDSDRWCLLLLGVCHLVCCQGLVYGCLQLVIET